MQWFSCPIATCRAENDVLANVCIRCGTPLNGYKQLSIQPAQLFNEGLAEARSGQVQRARDLFAAIVYWCPKDREARNALAMACFAIADYVEAQRHWHIVLDQSPQDNIALRGVKALEIAIRDTRRNTTKLAAKKRIGKKARWHNRDVLDKIRKK